jgi:hypothetical protein
MLLFLWAVVCAGAGAFAFCAIAITIGRFSVWVVIGVFAGASALYLLGVLLIRALAAASSRQPDQGQDQGQDQR